MAEKLTIEEARKVAAWCKKQLGLPHWTIKFYFEKVPKGIDIGPDDLGSSTFSADQRRAKIWVSLDRSSNRRECISTICHEYLHVFYADKGIEAEEGMSHNAAYQQENLYTKAYLAGVK